MSGPAQVLIILALGEDHIVHFGICETAHDGWRKFAGIYGKPSTANRMHLYEKLITLHLTRVDDVWQHVHELARTRTKLPAVEVVIDCTVNKQTLLCSL